MHVLSEGRQIERLGEHIRVVEVGGHVFDHDLAECDEFAHLQIATLNVARTLARLHVLGELDGTLVVHIERGGLELASKLEQQTAEVHDLGSSLRSGHDFGFSGGQGNALLPLAAVANHSSSVEDGPPGGGVADSPVAIAV